MLREQLRHGLEKAMKDRDRVKVSTLRLITSALKERDRVNVQERSQAELPDSEIMSMLQSMIKQRQESINAYARGGREDLVAKETAEKDILQSFLPKALEGEALEAAIETAMDKARQEPGNAEGLPKNAIGQIIGQLKALYPGQIDMSKASGLIKTKIGR